MGLCRLRGVANDWVVAGSLWGFPLERLNVQSGHHKWVLELRAE